MAITKIHPIKSTLNLAIDYITDEEKTSEKILISSNKCHAKTAHLQMLNTRDFHKTRGTVLARHLIQSFFPGEVTTEKAHEIGQELCDKILGQEYEYVLTTHVDRGHIHNHIIFNNVSLTTGKCYQSNKKSYHKIRLESDKLCEKNKLIVIDEYYSKFKKKFKTKGKSYKEYQESKQGNSWKSKLQFDIDRAIAKSNSWEEFLKLMTEYSYEIKYGKHIAFKYKDKERFTRARTIGEDYTEERLKERIAAKEKSEYKNVSSKGKSPTKLIDITTGKFKDNKGLQFWAKKQNLKLASNTLLEIRRKGIKTAEGLDEYVKEIFRKVSDIQVEMKVIDEGIGKLSNTMELAHTVVQNKKYHDYYAKNKGDKNFVAEYKTEIESYEKALKELKKDYPTKMPNTKTIFEELEKLQAKRDEKLEEYTKTKESAYTISRQQSIYKDYMKKDVER